jgi:hypothetical protein
VSHKIEFWTEDLNVLRGISRVFHRHRACQKSTFLSYYLGWMWPKSVLRESKSYLSSVQNIVKYQLYRDFVHFVQAEEEIVRRSGSEFIIFFCRKSIFFIYNLNTDTHGGLKYQIFKILTGLQRVKKAPFGPHLRLNIPRSALCATLYRDFVHFFKYQYREISVISPPPCTVGEMTVFAPD